MTLLESMAAWYYDLPEAHRRVYNVLSILLAVLSVAFVIVYYNDVDVVKTCFQFGAEIPCP